MPYYNNNESIPNRMRLYENISHFQQSSSLPPSNCQTPIKKTISPPSTKSPIALANAERRKMFFNSELAEGDVKNDDIIVTEANNLNTMKISSSTGCTPQDSFSDDSSYLSALSRVRFSPENFLDVGNSFSTASRMAVANMQRAMVKRTIELEEGEK
jgi:hypothetical protein